jgi:hypothetical protein
LERVGSILRMLCPICPHVCSFAGRLNGHKKTPQAVNGQLSAANNFSSTCRWPSVAGHCYHSPLASPGRWHEICRAVDGSAPRV